ncbi:MAG: YihA family ribosome biogenesis GTP-binding protein [Deltaproteobacteria bacterium]|nr:YihA family ribosome biogenesis GTP-binding protein [Deltaproteobacteria bacterium]
MKVTLAEFRASAATPAAIPAAAHPEVAIAGRSNVGKSSLINRMTGRRSLARTSRTPGCTRGLIFYDVNAALTLVDLPGYGYASRSQTERRQWKTLVERYLATREELAGVLILVDCRRGPQAEELELAEYLTSVGLAYTFVMTKTDKLGRSELSRRSADLREALEPAPVIATSSESGAGIDTLWKWIRAAIATERQG